MARRRCAFHTQYGETLASESNQHPFLARVGCNVQEERSWLPRIAAREISSGSAIEYALAVWAIWLA